MAKKAGVPKKQKAKPKLTDKEQSERFIEAAREIGVDESGKTFEKSLIGILRTPARKSGVAD